MARVVVGTSGWHYASWRGPFFPHDLLVRHQLRYYASQFETGELNGVFYRTPTEASVQNWYDQTGTDFVFAWKASKFITHWKRLSERSVNSLTLMENRLSLLGNKAGPVLFQLPPQFEANHERLASFLPLLAPHRRYSFEFRHPSWFTPSIMRLLKDANISLCLSDHHDAPAPWKRTADFVYVRGHGPDGRYKGQLSRRHAEGLGQALPLVVGAWHRRLCLFRQRSEECGARRRIAAACPAARSSPAARWNYTALPELHQTCDHRAIVER